MTDKPVLPWWFARSYGPAISIPFDLGQEGNYNLHWAGQHPPPEKLSLWDKRRRDLGIEHDCGCVAVSVDACYNKWYGPKIEAHAEVKGEAEHEKGVAEPEKGVVEGKEVTKAKGATNLILRHFHYLNEYTDDALHVVEELMLFTENITGFQSTFLEKRYNLDYDGTMVILEHVNKVGWFDHGSGARSSWLSENGRKWLNDRLSKKQQVEEGNSVEMTQELLTWYKQHPSP